MKRLSILLLSFLILLCGCSKNKAITVFSSNISAVIDITSNGKQYTYKFTESGNTCKFISCGNTVAVDFIWRNGGLVTRCGKSECEYGYNVLELSPVNIIKKVLNNSNGKTVTADYNGNYILHSVIDNGEYSLKLDTEGKPTEIKVNSLNLYAKINGVKEV